jgi:hypothetical protein
VNEADIANLKRVINHQAEMQTLWSEPYGRLPTMQETVLKAALRHLHAIVEKDNNLAFKAHKVYWDLESDL